MRSQQVRRCLVGRWLSIVAGVPVVSHATELQELTVTAQRRVARAQDAGISISQFSGEAHQDPKITRVKSIAAPTPGLSVKNTFGEESPTFTFRGIGTNDASAINNKTVNSYVDGVPKPNDVMLGGTLFNLEPVEILKDPRGTLYGSNDTGGAVNFITCKPEHAPSAHARIDYGSYQTIDYWAGRFKSTLLDRTLPLNGALFYMNWVDEKFFEPQNNLPIRQGSCGLVNAGIAVATSDDRRQVALWSRNVFNQTYFMDIFAFTETTGTGLGQVRFPREGA